MTSFVYSLYEEMLFVLSWAFRGLCSLIVVFGTLLYTLSWISPYLFLYCIVNRFSLLFGFKLRFGVSHCTPQVPLRKHAYSNILKILPPKNENFQMKNSDIFHISAQNINCGYSLEPPRRGGSNEYPQSMFWAEIRKIIYTPVNPSFTI